MKKVLFRTSRILVLFFSFSAGSIYVNEASAALNLDRLYTSTGNGPSHYLLDKTEAPGQITEEQVLDEIERISKELDTMEQSGQLDLAKKYAIAGLLGTIAYGLAHAQIVWLFQPALYSGMVINGSAWINAVLVGIINTVLPGLAVGTVLGFANYFPGDLPQLPFEELVEPGLIAIITTLGMTLLGAALFPACHHCVSFPVRALYTAYLTVPVSTLGLVVTIYSKRKDLHRKRQLDLKHRLEDARKVLEQKKAMKADPEPQAVL